MPDEIFREDHAGGTLVAAADLELDPIRRRSVGDPASGADQHRRTKECLSHFRTPRSD